MTPHPRRITPDYYVRNRLTRELVAGPFQRAASALAFAADRNRACGARVYGLARHRDAPACGKPRIPATIAIHD